MEEIAWRMANWASGKSAPGKHRNARNREANATHEGGRDVLNGDPDG
jgi:hypothetical protein